MNLRSSGEIPTILTTNREVSYMKKKLKGMTLVELLVAITILGLGSTMLAAASAQVAMVNRENHQFNERMSSQIKIAENESQTNNSASNDTPGQITIKVTSTDGGASTGTYTMSGHTIYIKSSENKQEMVKDINFKYFVTEDP